MDGLGNVVTEFVASLMSVIQTFLNSLFAYLSTFFGGFNISF